MGKGTMIGIIAGLGAIFVSLILEGGNPASLIAPPALVLILVGTFGAACGGTSLERALDALKSIALAFKNAEDDRVGIVERCAGYAEVARRDGLLALEGPARDEPDLLLSTGLRMLIDGGDVHESTRALQSMAMSKKKIWDSRSDFFTKMGGYAPTLGIIGTVLGLIHTLESLGGDPAELGHLIAAAFIATFFGVTFANIVFLPIGTKFKAIGAAEVESAQMVISAVEGMAAGLSPRVLRDRLAMMLPPDDAAAVLSASQQKVAS